MLQFYFWQKNVSQFLIQNIFLLRFQFKGRSVLISPESVLKFGNRDVKQFYIDFVDESSSIMRLIVNCYWRSFDKEIRRQISGSIWLLRKKRDSHILYNPFRFVGSISYKMSLFAKKIKKPINYKENMNWKPLTALL